MLRPFVCCALVLVAVAAAAETQRVAIPDVALLDQEGRSVKLYSDLVKDRVVVMNFIFTSCTTICSPMGANFAALQKKLGDRKDVELISISLDPAIDTPARLKSWSRRFKARPGWTLLTGESEDIDRVLKAVGADTPDRYQHSALLLVGNDRSGEWTRANGLASPATILQTIQRMSEVKTAAGHYFGEVELVNQSGQTMRLYSDVLRGKTVVINSFFATCTGSCPVMGRGLAAIQSRFSDRLGKDLWIVSISVDPETDTPARLQEYASRMHAQRGWLFLTGSKSNVDQALTKLGQYVAQKSDHQNIMIIGNERTGLWKKAFGMARPDDLIKVVESVLDDRG